MYAPDRHRSLDGSLHHRHGHPSQNHCHNVLFSWDRRVSHMPHSALWKVFLGLVSAYPMHWRVGLRKTATQSRFQANILQTEIYTIRKIRNIQILARVMFERFLSVGFPDFITRRRFRNSQNLVVILALGQFQFSLRICKDISSWHSTPMIMRLLHVRWLLADRYLSLIQ